MAVEFSQLPDAVVTLIFEKTGVDPTTLGKCCLISKRYARLARLARVAYVPSIRLPLRIRENPHDVQLTEGFVRPASTSLAPQINPLPFPPQNPRPTFLLSYPAANLPTLFQNFISSVGGGVLTQSPTPATLEIVISFPDRPSSPDHGVLVKWKGVFSSRADFSFAFALADDVHPSHLPPLPVIDTGLTIPRSAQEHFWNFICMAELVKGGGDWFHSLDQISIFYTRRMGRVFMGDDERFSFSDEEFYYLEKNIVRVWPLGSLTNLHGRDFQLFSVGVVKGRDINEENWDDVDDEEPDPIDYDSIMKDAFADDPLLHDATIQASTTDPQSFTVRDLRFSSW